MKFLQNFITRSKAIASGFDDWQWLILITAALRLPTLGNEALWYDESFSAWLARLPLDRMFDAIRGDVHPPLYYLLLWGWTRIAGQSEFALRLPSAILGILCVLLVWRLAGYLGLSRLGSFAAGLFAAVMPSALYYSQETRMYTLLCFLVLWMVISAINERWWWLAFSSFGALLTQNLAVFYVVAIWAFVVMTNWKQTRRLIMPGVVAAASYGVLWLPSLIVQMNAVKSAFWIPPLTIGGALYALIYDTIGWRLPDNLQIHAALATFGLSSASVMVALSRKIKDRSWLILLWSIIAPPVIVAVISVVWRAIYLPRAFMPSAMLLCILFAYVLTQGFSMRSRVAAIAIIFPVSLMSIYYYYIPATGERLDVRTFVAPIKEGWSGGDAVYAVALDSAIVTGHYLQTYPRFIYPYPTDLNQSLTPQTRRAMGFVESDFEALGHVYSRAWLIITSNPMTAQRQLDEIQRIKDRYHPTVISSQHKTWESQEILLVTFPQ